MNSAERNSISPEDYALHPHLRFAQAAHLQPPSRPFASGGVPVYPNSRETSFAADPRIAQALATNAVPSSPPPLLQYVHGVYDQYQVDPQSPYKCVAYATAAMMSIYGARNSGGQWIYFNAEECFAREGGTNQNGISPQAALSFACDPGFLENGSTQVRYPLASWHTTSPCTPDGQNQMVAAIAAENPFILQLYLPVDFQDQVGASGNCVSTDITWALHCVCVLALDQERIYFLNSEGETWGRNGLGSMLWGVLDHPQQQPVALAGLCTENLPLPPAARFEAPMLPLRSAPIVASAIEAKQETAQAT